MQAIEEVDGNKIWKWVEQPTVRSAEQCSKGKAIQAYRQQAKGLAVFFTSHRITINCFLGASKCAQMSPSVSRRNMS